MPVLAIALFADTPASGVQEIQIANLTGAAGCTLLTPVCDSLAITDWTLTVHYTSTYYNTGANPGLGTPFVRQWSSSSDDILATAITTVDFDLCGQDDISTCAVPSTQISSFNFTGSIDQSAFHVFDSAANGGSGGAGPLFFTSPDFSAVLSVTGDYPANYYESVNETVSQIEVMAPEPGTSTLVLPAVLLAAHLRRRAGTLSRKRPN